MRQVRIRVTCDACQAWHNVETEEGVETVPAAGGQTLDLCPSHRTELAPFLALVAEWGATPSSNGAGKGARAPRSAPVAPAETGKAPNRRGGARARQRRANASVAAPVATGALACPLCTQELASAASLGAHLRQQHSTTIGAVYGTQCPLCGREGVHGRHLSDHGVTGGMPGAFVLAEQQGDPHGVIAARAQAVAQRV